MSNIFGIVTYSINIDTKILEIDWINIYEDKPYVPIKFSKIILLYLLSLHSTKVEKITLIANPSYSDKSNTKFCLICLYETLGFTYIKDTSNLNITNLTNKCLAKLEEGKYQYENIYSSCILCTCQKNNIKFTNETFTPLEVEMDVLLPKLEKSIRDSYIEIKEICANSI